MSTRFADLHCHPTLYGFNRLRNGPDEHDPDRFHPWYVPASDPNAMEAGDRATGYAQIDFPKMVAGGVRIVFASITPIEAGFFRGNPDRGLNTSFPRELLKLASGATALRSVMALVQEGPKAALHEATAILRNEGPLRIMVQKLVMKYSLDRLRFMMSDSYDYWEEFIAEYAYLASKDGQRCEARLDRGPRGDLTVTGTYHLVRDPAHLEAVLDADEIAVILSIEGGHVFTIGPDQERVPTDLLFERINALKRLPSPLFFVTLAHHFDNGVCGHAHSLPDAGRLVMDQSRRMGEDLEAEDDLGGRVIRALLDLDDELNDLGGRRILIDAKHMSPLARQTFYRTILEPHNARSAEIDGGRGRIPLVLSHIAYANTRTLDELIAHADQESDTWHRGLANAWGINICDEDVQVCHRSGGLMGLVFDQRILGLRPGDRTPEAHLPLVLIEQLLALVDVVMLDDRLSEQERRTIWDCVCIGSDYDGVIDPLGCYPTALSLQEFAEDLRSALSAVKHTRMIDALGVDALVDKVCWRNAHAFLQRHFAAACGPPEPPRT